MATHSRILARTEESIPRTEELGGLQSWDSKESDTTEGLTHFISTNWLQEKKIILSSLNTSLYALLFPTTKTTILLLGKKHISLLGEAH